MLEYFHFGSRAIFLRLHIQEDKSIFLFQCRNEKGYERLYQKSIDHAINIENPRRAFGANFQSRLFAKIQYLIGQSRSQSDNFATDIANEAADTRTDTHARTNTHTHTPSEPSMYQETRSVLPGYLSPLTFVVRRPRWRIFPCFFLRFNSINRPTRRRICRVTIARDIFLARRCPVSSVQMYEWTYWQKARKESRISYRRSSLLRASASSRSLGIHLFAPRESVDRSRNWIDCSLDFFILHFSSFPIWAESRSIDSRHSLAKKGEDEGGKRVSNYRNYAIVAAMNYSISCYEGEIIKENYFDRLAVRDSVWDFLRVLCASSDILFLPD